MKKSDGPGETFFRRGFAREEVQARGDDRYCKNARGNGAPEFLLQVVVIKVRADENGVPAVNTGRIGRESCVDGETRKKIRVPGKRVITNRARGFRQNHRKGDEREWLPKLRHLKPDKKRDESASCSREEATNGTLLGIVTQSC